MADTGWFTTQVPARTVKVGARVFELRLLGKLKILIKTRFILLLRGKDTFVSVVKRFVLEQGHSPLKVKALPVCSV